MGLHLHFRCPAAEPSPAFLSLAGAQPAFPRLYQDLPLYSSFASFPQCLWHMWQRVLCGESVAVYSASPQQCSAAVLALASLIAPIEYRGEVHPYLTIYDSNYSRVRASPRPPSACHTQFLVPTPPPPLPALHQVVHPYSHTRRRHSSDRSPAFGSAMRSLRAAVTATGLSPRSSSGPEAAEADEATDAPPPPPPRLVGVTNPLFCKNAPTWPNLLVLPSATSASASTSGDVGKSRAPFSMPYGRIPTPPGLTSGRGVASRAFSPKVLSPAAPLPEVGADGRAGGTVFSRARPLVPVFRDVLAQLLPVDRISMPVAGQDSPSRPGRAGIMNAAEHSLLVSTSGCAFVDSTGSGVEEASVRLPAAPHRTLGSREAGSHAKTSAAAAEAGAAPAREGSDESSDESGSDEARGWELGDDESDSVVPAVAINDSTLRQHFRHLTLAFLKPFRHFLTVAVSPPTGVVHAYADADELLRPFSEVALMARLAETGPPPPFGRCSEWKELYRRFVRSPHFRPWFAGQRQRAVARCGCILDKLRMGLDPEQLLAHTLRMEVDDRVSVYYRIVDAIDSVVRRRMRPSEGAARDSSDDSDNSDSGNGGDSGGGDGLLPIMHAHLRAVQDSLPASVLEAVVRSHGRSPHSSSSAGDP